MLLHLFCLSSIGTVNFYFASCGIVQVETDCHILPTIYFLLISGLLLDTPNWSVNNDDL